MKKLLQSLFVLMLCASAAFAQNRTITGTVTSSEDKAAIPGVSVYVTGTKIAVQTAANGSFTISVPANSSTLSFSFIGFAPKTVSISGKSNINVSLDNDEKSLSEVVVTGYQTIAKKDLVGNVSTVQSKDVSQKPAMTLPQLLQGKATGLQVTGASGRPGATAYIKIRGVGSLGAGTDPLILLDGVQINSSAYSSLNPNDIEDISILKDAASTSIYGSRAANGVIVIKTKLGKPGSEPILQYSFQYGKSETQDLKNVTLMTAAEKLQYEYELGYTNANLIGNGIPDITKVTPAVRQAAWDDLISKGAGDWSKYLLQKGTVRSHEVSLTGADTKMKYFLSLNSTDNDGTEILSFFNRKGGRLNVEYQAKEWFKMGTNIGITTSKERQVREPFNTQNLYASVFLYNPYEPVFNPDGSYNITNVGFSSIEGSTNNPVTYDRINSYGTIYAEGKFLKHLTLRTQAAVNYNLMKYQSYLKPGSNLAVLLGYNQKNDQGNQDFFYTLTNTANWNQTFGGKHNVNILVGQEFSKDNIYSYSLTGRNFPTASVETLENAATPTLASTSISEYALESYFAAANYNYDGKYYLSGSLRRDGSSRFGANNKYANFWSLGARWSILKEKFINVKWLNDLAIRGSVGTTGNNNIGNYTNLGTYALNVKYNDLPAAAPAVLPNPDLTWETSTQYDASLVFSLFDSRLSGEFGYYSRDTKNLLYPVNVSATTGFTSYQGNIGSMNNKGIEASLTGIVYRNEDWNVSLMANISTVKNTITSLYADDQPATASGGIGRFKIGEAANTYFLVKWAGINPANGKNQFYNKDGSVTETYSSSQAQVLSGKSPIPTHYGTIGADVRYKDFDLSARLYYTGGNYIMNYMDQVNASDGENVNNNQYTSAFNYWKKPGDIVRYANPLDPTQKTTYDTDKYLEKGNYVSLRDVTVGYTLPIKYAKYIKSRGVRVFFQGTNLALWTKFRGIPEVGEANRETTVFAGTYNLYGYPPIKSYNFGIDVRF
eukprot:TRINITY_DN238_c0_g1_i1.p1 TRINITY_DN238_c0_g1~~TRINITY_DN238_c0_g1_i1.p1  ORF type:complete len:1011 (-),score=72.66 TRINITY_DN238_c0_g1_i1:2627-5629(-)